MKPTGSSCNHGRSHRTAPPVSESPSLREFSALQDGRPMTPGANRSILLPGLRLKEAVLRGVKDSELSLSFASDVELVPGGDFAWTVISATTRPETR
jgi:hypothetical protein